MAEPAVQTEAESRGPSVTEGFGLPPEGPSLLRKCLAPLASLRLTVVLFALATVLVFCGTLAQVDQGIWTVLTKYFRSGYVWIPFQIFFPRSMVVSGGFPFPGGWLIGGLLLVNLVCAHAVRFKVTWARSGILLIHAGIIVMLVSEAVTGLWAVEGNMIIREGETVDYLQHIHATELAVIDPSEPDTDHVVVVPGSLLKAGGLIEDERLPFDVDVLRYMPNSSWAPAPQSDSGTTNPATAGHGQFIVVEGQPLFPGTDARVEAASAYVSFKKKGTGESLGTYLVSQHLTPDVAPIFANPQLVSVDGKSYHVELRFQRTYKPYRLHLVDFRHDVFLGTDTPRNYSSDVRLVDPTRNEDRQVRIYMNHPLRYAGETFYQSSFLPGDVTVLQVVRNPGWLMPYISCVMVAMGMLVHFGLHLFKFLRRRIAV